MTDGQITNLQLYQAQRDTESKIGELAVQVATLVAEWHGATARFESGSATMSDHDERLTALERWRWQLAGAVALCGVLSGGGTVSLIVYALSRH
jgi:hypothetical protein